MYQTTEGCDTGTLSTSFARSGSPVQVADDVTAPVAPRVAVLLATYNGASYLPELLASLLAQSLPATCVDIRDDGSDDETPRLVADFVAQHAPARYRRGEHLGAAGCFHALLREADPALDYYAYCDQDDVWDPAKLARGIERLAGRDPAVPTLYFARVTYTDAELRSLGMSDRPQHVGLANALVENIASGCTMIMNRAARELLITRLPVHPAMHDRWAYLGIAAVGDLLYDDRPSIQYRQHAGNLIGVPRSAAERLLRRLRRQLRGLPPALRNTAQARELLACYGDRMPAARRALVEDWLAAQRSLPTRLAYAWSPAVRRQGRLDQWLLRLLIVLGRC